MTAAAAYSASPTPPVRLGALWFGLFGAPMAWSLQELASYALVTHACFPASQPLLLSTIGARWTIILAASLLLLLVGLAAGVTAYRSWRRTEPDQCRTRFMASGGVLVSLIFLLNLAANAAALFLVPPCG